MNAWPIISSTHDRGTEVLVWSTTKKNTTGDGHIRRGKHILYCRDRGLPGCDHNVRDNNAPQWRRAGYLSYDVEKLKRGV